jgi:hypothetical protein
MKAILSNQMVKALKAELTGIGEIKMIRLAPDAYKAFVDIDVWKHEDDFLESSNTLRVAKLIYPAEDYAMPAYITTQDLKRCLAMSDRTWDGFFSKVREEYAI